MKTVQNDNIRVTVSDDVYESFRNTIRSFELKQVLPSGDVRYHSAEGIIRGRILSQAMEILGNRAEAEQLDAEPFELSNDELRQMMLTSLIGRWLDQHSKYGAGLVFGRYINGHRLSDGMAYEIDAASAYAAAAIGDLDYQALYESTLATYSETRQEHIFQAAREGKQYGGAESVLEDAIYWRKYFYELERRYRHRFDSSNFQIEILAPDNMPAQIGLCRYLKQPRLTK